MSGAKIEIKVGGVSFSGEGEEKWLGDQLEKLLKNLPQITKIAPEQSKRQGWAAWRLKRWDQERGHTGQFSESEGRIDKPGQKIFGNVGLAAGPR